jgi:hypothetical protein
MRWGTISIVDSHDGTNPIQRPHWYKGASHEWGSLIPMICAKRVVAAIEAGRTRVEVAELYNMALSAVGGFIKRKRETGSVRPDKFGGYKTFALEDQILFRRVYAQSRLAARVLFSCRPTARISIPSNNSSQDSNHSYAK